MVELYLGLVPGEAPIDHLIDEAIADPAFCAVSDDIADRIVGSVPAAGRDGDLGGGLWRHLRTRWTRAQGAPGG